MSANTNYWKLGLFVVLSVLTLIAALVFFGLRQLDRAHFDIYSYFDEPVDGLDVGSPVKFRGIKIGEVARIRPAIDEQHIEVTSHIYVDVLEDLGLRQPDDPNPPGQGAKAKDRMASLRVQLITSFLTGSSFIQTDFVDLKVNPPQKYPFLTRSPMIEAIPSTLRSLEAGLQEAVIALPRVLLETEQLLQAVHLQLRALKLPELTAQMQQLLTDADQSLRNLQDLPVMTSATATLNELQQLLTEIRNPKGNLFQLVATVQRTATVLEGELVRADVPATTGAIRTTAGELDLLGQSLRLQLADLERAIGSFRSLMDVLERDPGALLRGKSTTSPGGGK
jgi:paraquat-inducible protein B